MDIKGFWVLAHGWGCTHAHQRKTERHEPDGPGVCLRVRGRVPCRTDLWQRESLPRARVAAIGLENKKAAEEAAAWSVERDHAELVAIPDFTGDGKRNTQEGPATDDNPLLQDKCGTEERHDVHEYEEARNGGSEDAD